MEFTLDHEAPYFSNMRRRTSRKVAAGMRCAGTMPACVTHPQQRPAACRGAYMQGMLVYPCLSVHRRSDLSGMVGPALACSPPPCSPSPRPLQNTQSRCFGCALQDSDLNGVVDVRYTGGARMLLLIEVGTGRWRIKIPVMVSGEQQEQGNGGMGVLLIPSFRRYECKAAGSARPPTAAAAWKAACTTHNTHVYICALIPSLQTSTWTASCVPAL